MTSRLAHRGPDGEGFWHSGPIALGHRRLAVIDLSDLGGQPMSDVDGQCTIVFNGEIYNFRDLRRELESGGARFVSNTDTEVILEAYKKWDVGCLEHLNGMFAFALWDTVRERLLLARDRLGEKPLFYHVPPRGGLVFASDLRGLREHPAVPRRINARALGQFLSIGYVLAPDSFADRVNRLEPAHALIVERDKPVRTWCYWNLADCFRRKASFRSERDASDALAAMVDDAVRMRLESDVPLGAFLSGGIDSSAVVAAMSAARPPAQNHTFSIGFGEPTYDEVPEARAVAASLGVVHRDEIVHPDMSAELPRIAGFMDEPLADTSVIPMFFLSAFARRHVTVCLSGDGGDENFAGYDTYIADRLKRATAWIPRPVVRGAAALAGLAFPVRFSKAGAGERLRRYAAGQALPVRRAHCTWRQILSDRDKTRLVRPELRDAIASPDPFERFERHYDDVADLGDLDQSLYVDMKTWLADDILTKVDRSTMAHSLESRAPFLDHRLVEFAASLPAGWKLNGWRTKHILKESQRHRLPARTVDRAKRGFNAPVSHWMNGPLGDVGREAFSAGRLQEWFDPNGVETLWAEHRSGRADHGLALFELTCLGLWRAATPLSL
jgi:asparagine synthase (glutamine-hydrolysing)